MAHYDLDTLSQCGYHNRHHLTAHTVGKGEIVNPLGIFDSKYRRYMAEFFITMA